MKRLCGWLVTGITVLTLCACVYSNRDIREESEAHKRTDHAVNLVYYTIGNTDKDLELVNEAINEALMKKLGITITYNKINWRDYETKLNALVASGSSFDVAFAVEYGKYAQRGVFLALDQYLKDVGRPMYEAIDPLLWEGVKLMDGSIYGVPTNKELSVQEHWMYPKELITKYNLDISEYKTLASLAPVLQLVKENEPDYLPMELDKNSNNFFALEGYEYVTSKMLPLAVNSTKPELVVENVFQTETALKIMKILRAYYLAGYINEDAALKESNSLEAGKKVFWKQSSGGIYSESSWSRDRGYPLVSCPVTPLIVTTEHTRGGVISVFAETLHPVECMQFLNLLNTDEEVRNLFNYGIEGVHYMLNEEGQVIQKPPYRYLGVQYTQGNWFILKTMEGDPLDKWDLFRQENKKVHKSPLLGFTPDLSHYEHDVENIRIVWEKYYPCLMTGSVDVNTVLPKFLEELKAAGMGTVQIELQQQLDEWMKGKQNT